MDVSFACGKKVISTMALLEQTLARCAEATAHAPMLLQREFSPRLISSFPHFTVRECCVSKCATSAQSGHKEPSQLARRHGRSPSTTGHDRCIAVDFLVPILALSVRSKGRTQSSLRRPTNLLPDFYDEIGRNPH